MGTEERKTIIKNLKLLRFTLWFCIFSFSLLAYSLSSTCLAVSSKIVRHSSGADFLDGRTEETIVGSQGTIQLGRSARTLVSEEFVDVWSINSIVASGGTVFLGTSPNGGIYKYTLGELTKIYPAATAESAEPGDANEPDVNAVEVGEYLSNEHIFAMVTDVAGRLLAGISGDECRLLRFEGDEPEVIFEPNPVRDPTEKVSNGANDAKGSPPCGGTKYIFAITTDEVGNIYLGTGPEGKVYRLNSFGREVQVVYDSRDKNILSLAIGRDGFVYAGSDSRGLVYRINPDTKTAAVLYDSDQPEITALLFSQEGELYAAATSARITAAEAEFAEQLPLAGRPEPQAEKQDAPAGGEGGLTLKIANTKADADDKEPKGRVPPPKPPAPGEVSHIYRITRNGFVTDIFSERAVFFCLAAEEQKLLIGTGNSGRLFTVDEDSEDKAVVYEDEQASQITSVVVSGDDVYLGTANPAKLIKLAKGFATEGTYISELIDAGQPARWGKLQIDADIPGGCKVMAASRSGNVRDINDPTFSDWTEPAEVTGPVQLGCPPGRFCQYKLVLQSADGTRSPLVREVAVASTVPNLAPRVESVSVSRIEKADKTGMFKISYKSKDDNDDKLIYKIDFRRPGRANWIELEDKIETDTFEWDAKTVEDGRYEVRITASDERSNTTKSRLTGSRISEPVVVDNTGPVVKKYSIVLGTPYGEKDEQSVTLKLEVSDELSVIGRLNYTVDSNAEWIGAVPDDLVYDTTDENFTVVIEDLKAGEHIIAVRASDDVGNTTYKTFEVEM